MPDSGAASWSRRNRVYIHGISLPGTGETPVAPVYVDGEKTVTLKGERIAEEFQAIVEAYVRATYGGEPRAATLNPERKTIAVKAIG